MKTIIKGDQIWTNTLVWPYKEKQTLSEIMSYCRGGQKVDKQEENSLNMMISLRGGLERGCIVLTSNY